MMTSGWYQNVQTASSILTHEHLLDIMQDRFMQDDSMVSGKDNAYNSITPHYCLHECSSQKSNKVVIQGMEHGNWEAYMTQTPL